MEKLLLIQNELRAPRDLKNLHGGYFYRSCASILEAVKPLLLKHRMLLTLTDDVVVVADRIYVKATARLIDLENKESFAVTSFAREEEIKRGMDSSQITGASASYARKYALNGLFLIDDNRDSDDTNQGEKDTLKTQAEIARAKFNQAQAGVSKHDDLGQMVPRDLGVPPAGDQPDSTESGVVGFISEPNAGGYISCTLQGVKDQTTGKTLYFTTREPSVLMALVQAKKEAATIRIIYKKIQSGKYINNTIADVIQEVPF